MSIAESVSTAAHEAIDNATPKLTKLETDLRNSSSKAKESINEKVSMAKTKASEGVEQSRDFARKNPLLTLGIAFTAGALVASLLKKK